MAIVQKKNPGLLDDAFIGYAQGQQYARQNYESDRAFDETKSQFDDDLKLRYDSLKEQMRQFNPLTTANEDDFIDAAAGGITAAPERIQSIPPSASQSYAIADFRQPHNWQGRGGSFDVQVEY